MKHNQYLLLNSLRWRSTASNDQVSRHQNSLTHLIPLRGGYIIVHQGDIRRSYHHTKTHVLSELIILCKCSKFKNFEDGHHSIIMHSPSASEEKWPPFNGGSWGTGLVRCNFHELTLLWDSIKPQKFPPQCTNNSPDYSIDHGCCKTQLEYIRKINIPRCTRKTSGYPLENKYTKPKSTKRIT